MLYGIPLGAQEPEASGESGSSLTWEPHTEGGLSQNPEGF